MKHLSSKVGHNIKKTERLDCNGEEHFTQTTVT